MDFHADVLKNIEVKQDSQEKKILSPESLQNIPAFLPYEAKQALLRELSRSDRKLPVKGDLISEDILTLVPLPKKGSKSLPSAENLNYFKLAITSPSHLEAHTGSFRLSMKGKFDVYLLWPFGKNRVLYYV